MSTKSPCLYVPTLEAKKAFLTEAHARGYFWGQTLAKSFQYLADYPDRHYAVEHWAAGYVDLRLSGPDGKMPDGYLMVNSPRQFFAYLKTK